MKCSIIIPHRNQPVQLKKCVAELCKYDYHRLHEIIVVDNDSDRQIDFLPSEITILYTSSMHSPYVARNAGIKASSHNLILLLDANCLIEAGFVEVLLNEYEDNTILAPQHSSVDIAKKSLFEKFDFLYSVPNLETLEKPKALPAGALFFNRNIIDDIGYFPEIRSLSDMKWTALARDSGYQLKYSESARFSYPYKDGDQFRKKYQRLGAGMIFQGNVTNNYIYVIKQFMPPTPSFVRNMKAKNDRFRLGLSWIQVIYLCYVVKINYGIGAIKAIFE